MAYRGDPLRALAQRVKVALSEARIIGSNSNLLRTLAAVSVKSATPGVRSSVLNWRWVVSREREVDLTLRQRYIFPRCEVKGGKSK